MCNHPTLFVVVSDKNIFKMMLEIAFVIERLTKVKSYLIVRVNYFTIVKNSFVKKRKFLKYVITQCITLLLWQEKLGMFGLKSHC